LPHESILLNAQAFSSIFLIPNVYFFWSGESYFSDIAFRPLLHLWSLGVELQFYIFVPLLIFLFKRTKFIFIALVLFSFAICIVVVELSPKTSFFLLPFRAWEFLIGFYLAMDFSNQGNIKVKGFSYIGFALLLCLFVLVFVDVNFKDHPGFIALFVCLASGMLIVFGLPERVLKLRIFRALEVTGKYSYSLYLVHFPLFFFFYYEPFNGETKDVKMNFSFIFMLILLWGLTYVSYHLFERGKIISFLKVSKSVFVSGLFVSLISTSIASSNINSNIHSDDTKAISNALEDRSEWRCGKYGKLRMVLDSANSVCLIGEKNTNLKSALLIGDSTADALKVSLARVLNQLGVALWFPVESCNVGKKWCQQSNLFKVIENKKIDVIFIHDLYRNLNLDKLSGFIDEVNKTYPGIRVIYIDPIPTWSKNLPGALYNRKLNGEIDRSFLSDEDYFLTKYKSVLYGLSELEKKGMMRIPTINSFCHPECELASNNHEPYYFDSIHLTLTGAKILEPAFRRYIKKYVTPDPV
jgi:hypothetical protein